MKRQFQEKTGKNKKENKRSYLRNIIVLLAGLNLILLFIFDYQVPGVSQLIDKVESGKEDEYSELLLGEGNLTEELTIQFKQDTINYGGDGELDLLSDVSVVDDAGNIYSKDNLTVEISGENKKEKTVRYIYSDKAGNTAEAERTLKLSHYDGPSIELNDNLPMLKDEDRENLKNAYSGYYTAMDGFGRDITSSVLIMADEGQKGDGFYELLFQVTNVYGDTVEKTVKVKAK